MFLNSLYSDQTERTGVRQLQYNRSLQKMVVQTQKKRLLNNVYLKFKTENNLVNCSPYDESG